MRRFSRVLVSTAGALLIAPLVVAAQAIPASAATGKLLVTTIDRSGQVVSNGIVVSPDIRHPGGSPTYTVSGKTISIADGEYAVLTSIMQLVNNGTTIVWTIAETTVTVSGTGTTKVTLDARQGHPINVTLDGKPVNGLINAQVCEGSTSTLNQAIYANPGNELYVVPSTSSLFHFAYSAQAYSAQGQSAVVAAVTSSGVPANPGGAWTSSQLANVTLNVRSHEQLGDLYGASVETASPNGGANCRTGLETAIGGNNPPTSYSFQVSPGYWDVRTSDDLDLNGGPTGVYDNDQRFAAGHSYSYTYYSAAWAPAADVYTTIRQRAIDFTPPLFTDPNNLGSGARQTLNHLGLSLNGHLLASDTAANDGALGAAAKDFQVRIRTAGWYTLTDTATPDAVEIPDEYLLSPEATLAWRFYASPSESQEADGFWTSFVPRGLDGTNSAAPRSQTTVTIRPYRDSPNQHVKVTSDSVKKLQVWWSGDGAHWKALAVHHNASGWYVTVPNPAKGVVSLRAEVTGSHGDTSTETVYKAYNIS